MDTYVKLNQPKDAVAEAKLILADDPKDFTSLYYTMYLRARLAGNKPTPDVLDQGEKATTALLANIDTPPPNVTADQWKGARTAGGDAGSLDARMDRDATQNLGLPPRVNSRRRWQLDPNNAEVDYFMGTVIASEKNPQKMPVGDILLHAGGDQ